MKNYFGEEIEDGKLYNFTILVSTAYHSGTGWGEADVETQIETENALNGWFGMKDWMLQPKDDVAAFANVWYKGYEEAYVHPEDILGCAKLESILSLKEYFDNLDGNRKNMIKSYELRIYDEVKTYCAQDIFKMSHIIDITYLEVAKEHPYGIALNSLRKIYPEFKFRNYSYVTDYKHTRQRMFEAYLIELLNTKIRGIKKEK